MVVVAIDCLLISGEQRDVTPAKAIWLGGKALRQRKEVAVAGLAMWRHSHVLKHSHLGHHLCRMRRACYEQSEESGND